MGFFALCAVNWTAYLLDLVIILFIVGFTFICARRGFVECFFGFVSSVVAGIVALSLAKVVVNATGGLFGLEKALGGKFKEIFEKVSGFDKDVSALGVQDALQQGNVSAILTSIVLSVFGKSDLPAGTTIGSMLGVSVAKFAVTLLCGMVIFFAVKLVIFLLKKILKAIIEKISLLNKLDATLGAIVGLLQSVLIVCLILFVLTLIPSQTITNYLDSSLFVGVLYNYNPLVHIISWIL